jgi:DNA modification methylase
MRPYYDDGTVVIYHGDCRNVLQELTADVLVTDPPYGINHSSKQEQGEGKWCGRPIVGDASTESRDWVIDWWGSRPAVVFGSWKRARPSGLRAVLVWDKGLAAGMGDLSVPWKPNWEEVYILGDGFSGRRDSGVISGYTAVTWSTRGRLHPNEKPVGLMRDLILKCPPGVILDPFAGSGTTLRAAKDVGRRAIGVEVDEHWCEVAARRLSQEVLPLEVA